MESWSKPSGPKCAKAWRSGGRRRVRARPFPVSQPAQLQPRSQRGHGAQQQGEDNGALRPGRRCAAERRGREPVRGPARFTRPSPASRGRGGGRGSGAQKPHVAHDLGGSSRAGEGAGTRRPLAKRAEPPAGPRLGAEEAGPARSPRRARNPGLGGGQKEKALPPGLGRGTARCTVLRGCGAFSPG